MASERRDPRADALLIATHELARLGVGARSIADRLSAGGLTRVRRGWYAETAALTASPPHVQQLAAMLAAQHEARCAVLFGHRSAATAHGLPVWSAWLRTTERGGTHTPHAESTWSLRQALTTDQVVSPGFRASRTPNVRYHQSAVPDSDRVEIAGFPVTSADRTLFDIARSEPFSVALACADKYLRDVFRVGPYVDEARWREWQAAFSERIAGAAGVPGIRRVRALAALADPRADSPLESVSRLRLTQLGIDAEPQYAVASERGSTYFLDFWFLDAPFFGECDGKSKYTDAGLRNGRSAEEVVYREKRRQDWIVGTTGRRAVRWGAADVITPSALRKRLTAFGVPVPGRPSPRVDPATAAVLRGLA